MKLRNKKTGDIAEVLTDSIAVNVLMGADDMTGYYTSLAELNSEWEDVPEQKEYWSINEFGTLVQVTHTRENIYDKSRKSFGNYFETKEEAEQAVEKLKAWKRLKDKGFKFVDFNRINDCASLIRATFDESWSEIYDDLNLLFGGE